MLPIECCRGDHVPGRTVFGSRWGFWAERLLGCRGGGGGRGAAQGGAFPAVTYHHNFTYEMVDNLGKNRTEANVIKLGFVIPK